jgi:hypothetical protein
VKAVDRHGLYRRAMRLKPAHTATITIIAAALFICVPLLVEFVSGEFFPLIALALVLFLVALPGFREAADGSIGQRGITMTMVALGVLVVLLIGGEILLAVVSDALASVLEPIVMGLAALAALAFMAGIAMAGAGMRRAAMLPGTAVWVFLVGMLVAAASEAFEQSLQGPVPWLADVLPPAGFIVGGIGLLALGIAARRRAAGGSSAAEVPETISS